jgi:hypothetical protein
VSGSDYKAYQQSKSKSKPIDVTPFEYKGLRPTVASGLDYYARTGGPAYTGPLVAPVTNQEWGYVRGVDDVAMKRSAGVSGANAEVERTLRGDYLNPESNPFLRAYVDAAVRPITEAREESNLADRAQFARAGHRLSASSPFARAYNIGERGYADAISDVATNVYGTAYESERGRMADAVSKASMLQDAEVQRWLEGMKAAALPRLVEQLGIDAGREEFNRRVDVALQALATASGLNFYGTKSKGSSFGVQKSESFSYGGGGASSQAT